MIVDGKGDTNGCVDGCTAVNSQKRVNSAAVDDVRVVGGVVVAAVDIGYGTLMLWGSAAYLLGESVQKVAVVESDEEWRETWVQGTRCVRMMCDGVVVNGDGGVEEVGSSHGQRKSRT